MLLFEWDTKKAKKNIKVHGISFDEASTVLRDTLSLTIYDPLHSDEEDRLILIGNSQQPSSGNCSYGKRSSNQTNNRKKSNKKGKEAI